MKNDKRKWLTLALVTLIIVGLGAGIAAVAQPAKKSQTTPKKFVPKEKVLADQSIAFPTDI